jgi:peptide/nickel transport system substrate-binding protein
MQRRSFLIGSSAAAAAVHLGGFRAAMAQAKPGELVWADNLPAGLDPHVIFDVPMQFYMLNVYDQLYQYEGNPPQLKPWLASGHSVTPDGLVWTITLRDAKFHDGSPITAEDVVYSFRRLLTIKRGPSAAFLPVLAPDKITAVDAKTVKFELKHAYQPFHSALPLVSIVNPRVIKANEKDGDWGQAWLASNAAGSGPYTLDAASYKPDEAADLKRNPAHFMGWGHNSKPIDIVRCRNIKETNTRVNALIKGDIDATDSYLPTDQVERVQKAKNVKVIQDETMRVMVIRMNNQKPPFDNVHFRRAISHAFNYKGFISGVLKDYAIRNAGPIPQNLWGAPKDLKPYEFNLDLAKEELAKAKAQGAPIEREVEIHIQQQLAQTTQAAQVLQQELRKINVNLKIAPNLWGNLVSSTAKADTTPDMWVHWVSTYFVDPENWIGQMYDSQFHGTWKASSWYKNAKVDQLLRDARSSPDQAKRQAAYEEASRIVVADAADIWIYNTVQIRGISARLQGYKFSPVGSGAEFRHMSLTA